MTYKISLHGWGSECVAGKIPDNVWKYIQDECDGDAKTNWTKMTCQKSSRLQKMKACSGMLTASTENMDLMTAAV